MFVYTKLYKLTEGGTNVGCKVTTSLFHKQ